MKSRYIILVFIISVLAGAHVPAKEFIRGVDISIQTRQEAGDSYSDGVVYHEYGEAKDVLDIFVNHDINWTRIRLFHAPSGSEYGVCQDLDYVTNLAQRVKSKGMKFLLDIHYSDTWADPSHQTLPNAWANFSHQELVDAVFSYSYEVITHLQANNAMPDMVQIGNETTCGMLWPDGNTCTNSEGWDNYAELVRSAYDGIAAACENGAMSMPEIMIHTDQGGDKSHAQWYFNELITRNVPFDIIGLSFYPEWHGTIADLRENVENLAQLFNKDICLAEIGNYYTSSGNSPESQKEFIEEVLIVLQELPNEKGRGLFYWEPTWVWSSPSGYRALFAPINNVWDRVDMLMAVEAFNISERFSTYSDTISGSSSGSIMDGHNSDNKYEALTESYTGSGNYSYLEHKWTINNITDNAVFMLEAFKTDNSGEDNFIFSWSTDAINYTDMFAVFKTSDDNTILSYDLPDGIDGAVYIKVKDTNRSSGSNILDTLYIDNMYIQVATEEECGVSGFSEVDLYPDCKIDLKDFAIFAEQWLASQ